MEGRRPAASWSLEERFRGRDPGVRATHDRIMDTARRFGPVGEEARKTSIHLTNRTAFAGVATRRTGLILTLKLPGDLESSRVSRHERVSANPWHLEIKLSAPKDVDAELRSWLRQPCALAG